MNIQREEVERIKNVIGNSVQPTFPMVFIWSGKKWVGYRGFTFAMLITALIIVGSIILSLSGR